MPTPPIDIYTPDTLPSAFNEFSAAPVIDPDGPAAASADAHLLVRDAQGEPTARCSVWAHTKATLSNGQGEHKVAVGYVGHYAARVPSKADHASEEIAHSATLAAALLQAACNFLSTQGCGWAVGPLDGSTFHRYRFLTERSVNGIQYPPFFLEPDNPDSWPQHFLQAGFAPLARYHSAIGPLTGIDLDLETLQRRGTAAGARLRPVDPENFEAELQRVYTITEQSFAQNFLYTPISAREFIAQYRPIHAYLQPELVWLAEKAGQTIGFVFGLPNLTQAQHGEPVDTFILKTVGILPNAGVLGLGNWLTAHCQQVAYELGYRRVIHALMHDANISSKISRRYAQPMRRYTLYAKRISGQ